MSSVRQALGGALLSVLLGVTGCGTGKYGYAPQYAPLPGEVEATKAAVTYEDWMASSEPGSGWDKVTSVFGVVENRGTTLKGEPILRVQVRRLRGRNLCGNFNDPTSCRVTVSDAPFGTVPVIVPLTIDDDMGPNAVGPGSLVRVVGTFGRDFDAVGGKPILRATFYRHWPRGQFVTDSDAVSLRQ